MSIMQDKVVVITGGNSGIGLASAKAFVADGARVALFGRDADTLEHAVNELGEAAVLGPVTDEQVRAVCDSVKK